MVMSAVLDSTGRHVADAQPVIAARPNGPWDSNAAQLYTECAWCRIVLHDGDRSQGISHGICEGCAERFEKETA
jgi:hypothetical protein